MSTEPILNSTMRKHPRGEVRVYSEDRKLVAGTSCAGYLSEFEAASKPREVTTAEQLDALRVGSVVLDRYGDAWHRLDGYEMWVSHRDPGQSAAWIMTRKPVTLLHETEGER